MGSRATPVTRKRKIERAPWYPIDLGLLAWKGLMRSHSELKYRNNSKVWIGLSEWGMKEEEPHVKYKTRMSNLLACI